MAQDTKRFHRIFVVVDPTRMIQPALIKGEWIAEREGAELVLYACIHDERFTDAEAEQQTEVELTREWMDRLARPARDKGINVQIRVEWDADWRNAVLAAAISENSDLVVKMASRHTALGRRLKTTSDLVLVQGCACPVLLVDSHRMWKNRRLLAAVKLKPQDEAHEQLNKNLLDLSHQIASQVELNLYAVTAYKGEDLYFDRQKFADLCGLPRDSVFAGEGAPERVIAKVSDEIGADMIVIGNPGVGGRNTAVLLIDQARTDILFLPES
ncbi:MAG TPA: universal stress protein [Gammaproteobacteria bacterium]